MPPGLALSTMFSLRDETMFGMILHEGLSNVALETFIWLLGRNMAKVFKVSKEPIGHFWSRQKFCGE